MHITLVEPFYGGSHKTWADSLKKYSSHQIEILSLEDRFWKWRMHGGAISLAKQFLEKIKKTDLILATDMLDLSLFASLIAKERTLPPMAMYFHENQLTYPWSPTDQDVEKGRDTHYGFINYASALVADKVFFNSEYHRDSFLQGVEGMLAKFPDHREKQNLELLQKKSQVLHLGVELTSFDLYKQSKEEDKPPIILWNHRWEYDKNPKLFFQTLSELKEEGEEFRLCVLGQRNEKAPQVFHDIPKLFADELIHLGTVESFGDYATLLWRADIHPTTSNQDFFGISVVEGIYCECTPLLPKRLVYPEHIQDDACFYASDEEFKEKLRVLIRSDKRKSYGDQVSRYGWEFLIEVYDQKFIEF